MNAPAVFLGYELAANRADRLALFAEMVAARHSGDITGRVERRARSDAIEAERAELTARHRRFLALNPPRRSWSTPLDRLTDGSIPIERQIGAQLAICKVVRGPREIGPRWRQGTNNPWGPREASLGGEALAACPHCGADGGELRGSGGRECCPTCGEEWVVGDYDWTILGDCLRYRADLAAGDVLNDEARPNDQVTGPALLAQLGLLPERR